VLVLSLSTITMIWNNMSLRMKYMILAGVCVFLSVYMMMPSSHPTHQSDDFSSTSQQQQQQHHHHHHHYHESIIYTIIALPFRFCMACIRFAFSILMAIWKAVAGKQQLHLQVYTMSVCLSVCSLSVCLWSVCLWSVCLSVCGLWSVVCGLSSVVCGL
jgi:fucose permease